MSRCDLYMDGPTFAIASRGWSIHLSVFYSLTKDPSKRPSAFELMVSWADCAYSMHVCLITDEAAPQQEHAFIRDAMLCAEAPCTLSDKKVWTLAEPRDVDVDALNTMFRMLKQKEAVLDAKVSTPSI